jgi:hypothetical protein
MENPDEVLPVVEVGGLSLQQTVQEIEDEIERD